MAQIDQRSECGYNTMSVMGMKQGDELVQLAGSEASKKMEQPRKAQPVREQISMTNDRFVAKSAADQRTVDVLPVALVIETDFHPELPSQVESMPSFFAETVLVADDFDESRSLLSDLLQAHGYNVVLASDGREALRLFAQHRVDLLLLDVEMPGMTGFEVCRTIKSDPKTQLIPVVLVTGLDGRDDRIRGIKAGADDFLTKPFSKEELTARVSSLLKIKHFTDELENAETVLFTLALGIEAKDPYTAGHCDRLSRYSVELAKRLGLPEELQIALRRAGVVHDIGKLAVPEHILQKPGPLTPEERKVMESHAVAGEHICAPLKSFRHVLPVIRHHHEKLDGTGYPDRLKGDAIPLTARILATVDVFDALSTERPYRKALPVDECFRIMQEEVRRGWWDVALVQLFEKVIAGD
jgi:cyclic di-GMP phosphodiesterase